MKNWQNKMRAFWRRYNYNLILVLILILAFFYRGWSIANLPQGLNRDEAAIAYNAFLLSQTGHDEWQKAWPIVLKSFGDTRLPIYPYLLAGLFRFLPTNGFIVRLPNVLAGVGIILLLYLSLTKMYDKKVALGASLLLALNPIFIWYSRGAWEVNLALFFLSSALFLCLDLYHSTKNWSVSRALILLLLLVLAFLTYNTPLMVVGAIWPFLPWLSWKRGRSFYLPLMLIILLALLPCLIVLLPATQMKSNITIFTPAISHHQYVIYREQFSGLSQKLWGNHYVFITKILLTNFLASFNPLFWWRGGAHPWHQLSGHNHLSLLTIALAYVALGKLILMLGQQLRARKNIWQSPALKWLFLLVVTLLPSIITVDAPHATRSLYFFYLLMIVIAVMFLHQVSWRHNRYFLALLVCFLIVESTYYFYHYQQILKRDNIFQAGLGEVLTADLEPTLIVSSQERPYQYIKLAWEMRMPPQLFWSTVVRENPDPAGIIGVSDLASYHFYDDDLPYWPNWRIIRYNKTLQRWEKIYD